jgi:hypothetical protein
MRTILVTGGSGFIGSHCILQLLAEPERTAQGAIAILCFSATIAAALLSVSDFALAAGVGMRAPSQTAAVAFEDFGSNASDRPLAAAWYQPPQGGRMRQGRGKEARQPAEPPGPKLVEVLPGGPTDDSDGAPACRRSCFVAAIRPCAGETLPRHPRDHVRLLPWL